MRKIKVKNFIQISPFMFDDYYCSSILFLYLSWGSKEIGQNLDNGSSENQEKDKVWLKISQNFPFV